MKLEIFSKITLYVYQSKRSRKRDDGRGARRLDKVNHEYKNMRTIKGKKREK